MPELQYQQENESLKVIITLDTVKEENVFTVEEKTEQEFSCGKKKKQKASDCVVLMGLRQLTVSNVSFFFSFFAVNV